MTDTGHKVPNWGAFKGMGRQEVLSNINKHCETAEDDTSLLPETVNETPPVFDPRSEIPDDGNFYACEHNLDRSEEEFDELGEGAIRQIGKNFITMASASVGVFAIVAAVMWSIPNRHLNDEISVAMAGGGTSMAEADRVVSHVDQNEIHATFVSKKNLVSAAPVEYIEVDVVLPIPSVIAEATTGEAPEHSVLMSYTGLSGPAPYPRSAALAAADELVEGPLAQGSDDEAVRPAPIADENKPWVSVMIPMKRPIF